MSGGAGFAVIDPGVVKADVGRDGLVVVAGEGGAAGLNVTVGGPGVDGVVGFDAVGAVEAQAVVSGLGGRVRCDAREPAGSAEPSSSSG